MAKGIAAFSLEGKVALVTGASRGLGKGIAIGLAEAGADVCITSRRGNHEDTVAAVRALGRRCEAITIDLSDRDARSGLIAEAAGKFGRLDILVNNAGDTYREAAENYSLERWDYLISLMLTGVLELSQKAARLMLAQGGGGKIVNLASLLTFSGGLTVPAYAAAKHGVAGLTKALCNEWASKGINVNAVAPGYMATDMTEPVITDPVRGPSIMSRIPAGRWGTPQDMVGAVVFLSGPASDYIHGHILVVDGGWMAR
ncbi:MAG TPA: SDR family oxidoreductase [Candidatus Brocadiia bacterium]|nr:SDR family oxidoreductase [Candidatus Brocadiia bacterium]